MVSVRVSSCSVFSTLVSPSPEESRNIGNFWVICWKFLLVDSILSGFNPKSLLTILASKSSVLIFSGSSSLDSGLLSKEYFATFGLFYFDLSSDKPI